jgi:hypothetical protein
MNQKINFLGNRGYLYYCTSYDASNLSCLQYQIYYVLEGDVSCGIGSVFSGLPGNLTECVYTADAIQQ